MENKQNMTKAGKVKGRKKEERKNRKEERKRSRSDKKTLGVKGRRKHLIQESRVSGRKDKKTS